MQGGIEPASQRRSHAQDLSRTLTPRAAEASAWLGAMLTSTARLCLPLDGIVLESGERISFAADSEAFRLSKLVEGKIASNSQGVI